MSPAIQLLLIQIMQLGALLAANPRYIVFTQTHGHVQKVEVRIYTADSEWREGSPAPTLVAQAQTYWEPRPWADDARQLRTQHELEFMRAALHAYLPADHTDITDLPEAA